MSSTFRLERRGVSSNHLEFISSSLIRFWGFAEEGGGGFADSGLSPSFRVSYETLGVGVSSATSETKVLDWIFFLFRSRRQVIPLWIVSVPPWLDCLAEAEESFLSFLTWVYVHFRINATAKHWTLCPALYLPVRLVHLVQVIIVFSPNWAQGWAQAQEQKVKYIICILFELANESTNLIKFHISQKENIN